MFFEKMHNFFSFVVKAVVKGIREERQGGISPLFWLPEETHFQSLFSHLHILKCQKKEDKGRMDWLGFPTVLAVRVKGMES